MASRIGVPEILLVLGLFVAALSLFVQPPVGIFALAGLSISFALPIGLFAYAAYWGFTIRKGLAVWLYRNQALGISLVSLAFVVELVGNFASITIFANNSFVQDAGFALRLFPVLLLTFYWIDASMRAIHDIDPLSRDTLHWSKLRYVLWTLNIESVGVVCIYLIVTQNYQNPPPVLIFFVALPLFVTGVSGIVSLPIGAVRSRDRNLRRQLEWFALSNFVLLVVPLILPQSVAQNGYVVLTGFLLGGYCLYRSARSLVPLNRRSLEAEAR